MKFGKLKLRDDKHRHQMGSLLLTSKVASETPQFSEGNDKHLTVARVNKR